VLTSNHSVAINEEIVFFGAANAVVCVESVISA
jgi:hypothetical protein